MHYAWTPAATRVVSDIIWFLHGIDASRADHFQVFILASRSDVERMPSWMLDCVGLLVVDPPHGVAALIANTRASLILQAHRVLGSPAQQVYIRRHATGPAGHTPDQEV